MASSSHEAPDVHDDPAPPRSETDPTSSNRRRHRRGIDRSDELWEAYVAQTKQVVLANDDEIADGVADAVELIVADDASGLATGFAPDEGAGLPDAARMLSAYPEILASAPASTIAVYAVGDATVYFGYSVVEWQDGGIVSQHTIAIPLRYIGGVWYFSTISLDTPGLEFVQSVQV